MKYYLAVDREERGKNRYFKLNLKNLEEELKYNIIENNNLKKLCVFTMSFKDEDNLKKFLNTKGILNEDLKNKKLVIIYQWDKKIKELEIPYGYQEKYFDKEYLANCIKRNTIKNSKYLKTFLNNFQKVRYYSDNYYLLLECADICMADFILLDRIKDFIDSYCYKNGVFKYRNFYELAMYVWQNDDLNKVKKRSYSIRTEDLSEAQQFKLEEWLDNVQRRKLEKK